MIIDTASNTTDHIECLKQAGVETIIRYYNHKNHTRLPTKRLEPKEANVISENGLNIVVIFQCTNNKALYFSKKQGSMDAERAFDWASTTILQPYGTAIYFAVDYNASKKELEDHIIPYFTAIQDVFNKKNEGNYKVGVYGSGLTTKTLYKKGLADYRWLSQSTGFKGTEEAIKKEEYELLQKYNPKDKICTLSIDRNKDNGEYGAFKLDKEKHQDKMDDLS